MATTSTIPGKVLWELSPDRIRSLRMRCFLYLVSAILLDLSLVYLVPWGADYDLTIGLAIALLLTFLPFAGFWAWRIVFILRPRWVGDTFVTVISYDSGRFYFHRLDRTIVNHPARSLSQTEIGGRHWHDFRLCVQFTFAGHVRTVRLLTEEERTKLIEDIQGRSA